jgi:uncharacterized protein (TIGR02001 family)
MNFKAILLASALVCAAPTIAAAQEVTSSVNVGVASDYMFRGINQNGSEEMQIFAGADVSAGNFYVGAWASNVDFGTEAELEVDFYLGVKPKIGNVTLDFGLLTYLYPQETNFNIVEAKAAASVASESGASLTGSVFYSPEAGKGGPSYWYGELAASAPIPGAKLGPFALSVNGSIGTANYETSLSLPDYTNYKIGLTAATESGWAVDLFYTDTDVENVLIFAVPSGDLVFNGAPYQGKTVLQLKRTF